MFTNSRAFANRRRIASAATLAALSVLQVTALSRPANACPECTSPFKPGTYTGEAKRVGNGVAYSWVTLGADGKPASIGVTLTDTALDGLSDIAPTTLAQMERDMFMLMLPKQAAKTAFNHISLDWNAKGHDPSGIYDKPHFDVHFYTIDLAAREKITAQGPDAALCREAFPAAYAPAGYMFAPETEIPMMGGHWLDPKSPELNGKPFTTTFLYGSYKGKMAFIEPMITRAFLQSGRELNETVALPSAYEKSAYYPTRYTVHHDSVRHEVTIALDGLTWRAADNKTDAQTSVASPVVRGKLISVARRSAPKLTVAALRRKATKVAVAAAPRKNSVQR